MVFQQKDGSLWRSAVLFEINFAGFLFGKSELVERFNARKLYKVLLQEG